MNSEIEPGRKYLLDKQNEVTVLKAVTRSKTIFNIETSDGSILSVEKQRLTLPEKNDNKLVL